MAGFGFSVGDFVAGISLINSLIEALNGTFGAKSEYRALISELYCLERAMVAIKELEMQEYSPEFAATQQAVRGCQDCIDKFVLKTASYQSLTAGRSSIRDHVRKITWSQCKQSDLHKFKEDLGVYMSAISVLLGTLQFTNLRLTSDATNSRLDKQTDLLITAVESVKDGDTLQGEQLQKIEKLLQTTSLKASDAEVSFVVRPLRLADAPVAPNFISRPLETASIEDKLLPLMPDEQQIVALSGPGGIGKSQLARQYAIKHQQVYDSIFWVDGRSEQHIRKGFGQMAESIPLPHVLDSNQRLSLNEGDIARALHAVQDWLALTGNNKWLLIIDNVDSHIIDDEQEDISKTNSGYDICKYIPAVCQGSLLVTSRLSLLARELGAFHVQVQEMQLTEGLELLHKVSNRQYNEPGAEQLVDKLGAYPLALMQAAKYIYENRCSTLAYLNKCEKNLALLVNQRPGKREYRNGTINVTLQLSWETLKSKNPEAAACLLLFGFLDGKDLFWTALHQAYVFIDKVPAELVWRIKRLETLRDFPSNRLSLSWLDDIAHDEDNFNEVVKVLHELSFVRYNEDSDGISIHAVIHDWIVWMCDPDTRTDALSLAADIVAWDYGSASAISGARLRPHADRCIKLGLQSSDFKTWNFSTLYLLGALYLDEKELELAQQLIFCAMEKLSMKYGPDHEMTGLWTARTSSIFIRGQPVDVTIGKLQQIESRLVTSVTSPHRRKNYLVDVRNQLTYAYQMSGNFAKAIEIGENIIESLSWMHLPTEYACCATGLLAESYLAQRKYESAKSYANVAIGNHEEQFGSEPNDGGLTAWRRRNITIKAIACFYLEEYEQAEVAFLFVYADAVRFEGADGALSQHAFHNLQCLKNARYGKSEGKSSRLEDVHSRPDNTDLEMRDKESPREMSTDIDVVYLRWDLAIPIFETIGYIDNFLDGGFVDITSRAPGDCND